MTRPILATSLVVLTACILDCRQPPVSPGEETAAEHPGMPTLPGDLFPQCRPGEIDPPDASTFRRAAGRLFIAGWIPYWRKTEGVESTLGHIDAFSEVNPFAYGVDEEGNLVDTARIGTTPWPELREAAGRHGVRVVPTVLWTQAAAMHRVFSDAALLDHHVGAIATMLEREGFPGIDIDYEGKDARDRDAFSGFLRALRRQLSRDGKDISCTVEARTADEPPTTYPASRTMAWANDFTALNKYCDIVRIMAYDESFLRHGSHEFVAQGRVPRLSNASISWVEQTIRYALRYVPADRLVLGIPTYGWEFAIEELPGAFRYRKFQSVSYRDAREKMRRKGVVTQRNDGGELSFLLPGRRMIRIVTVADAQSVADRVALAKRFGLMGVSLFKIDGLGDPAIATVLQEASLQGYIPDSRMPIH